MLKMIFYTLWFCNKEIDGDWEKGYVYILYWRITLKAESRKKDAMDKLNTIIWRLEDFASFNLN